MQKLDIVFYTLSVWKTPTEKAQSLTKDFVNDMVIPFLVSVLVIGLIVTLYYWYQDGQADNANFKKYLVAVVFIIIGIAVISSAKAWMWNLLNV